MRKTEDPVLHQQLQHFVETGRKAVGAKVFVACVTIDEGGFTGNIMTVSFEDGVESQSYEVVSTLARTMDAVLKHASNGKMKVMLYDVEADKYYDPTEGCYDYGACHAKD